MNSPVEGYGPEISYPSGSGSENAFVVYHQEAPRRRSDHAAAESAAGMRMINDRMAIHFLISYSYRESHLPVHIGALPEHWLIGASDLEEELSYPRYDELSPDSIAADEFGY